MNDKYLEVLKFKAQHFHNLIVYITKVTDAHKSYWTNVPNGIKLGVLLVKDTPRNVKYVAKYNELRDKLIAVRYQIVNFKQGDNT